MHLCADFHAGPSKEYLIFFLFISQTTRDKSHVQNLAFVLKEVSEDKGVENKDDNFDKNEVMYWTVPRGDELHKGFQDVHI